VLEERKNFNWSIQQLEPFKIVKKISDNSYVVNISRDMVIEKYT